MISPPFPSRNASSPRARSAFSRDWGLARRPIWRNVGLWLFIILLPLFLYRSILPQKTAVSKRVSGSSSPPVPSIWGSPPSAGASCDSTDLELSAPRGNVLQSAGFKLRWRSNDRGPFHVSVSDEGGRTVFSADTYGHEMRLLVSQDEGGMGGPNEGQQLERGRTYRWRVVPEFVPDPSACPTAQFRLLGENESRKETERFAAEAKKLGAGEETREPEATIALARLYLQEGFYAEAEGLLLRLREQSYDEKQIEGLLSDIYRKMGRQLSLAALKTTPQEPRSF
jgi:hypothetical protein